MRGLRESAACGGRVNAVPLFRREIPLTANRLERLATDLPSPEELAIAHEDGPEAEPPEPLTDELRTILRDFLPAEEAYLIEAYYVNGDSHARIATRLGCVKSAVQYRLTRTLERARWALQLETWRKSKTEIREDLRPPLNRTELSLAVKLWSNRWNQSRTAQELGVTQSHVRVRIMRLYRVLDDNRGTDRVAPYARDLWRVIDGRAWCIGSAQDQGTRAVAFPRLLRRKNKR